jgi:hypothetical protein
MVAMIGLSPSTTLSKQGKSNMHKGQAAIAATVLDTYKEAIGGCAWDHKATLSTEFTIAAYGLSGTGRTVTDLKRGRFKNEYTLGPTKNLDGYDGTNRWRRDISGTVTLQQGGASGELAINEAYRISGKWWEPDRCGAQIVDGGKKGFRDAACNVLVITPKGGNPFEAWFDDKTGLLVQTVERKGTEVATTMIADYRCVDDVMVPFTVVIDMGHGEKYLRTINVTRGEFLDSLPDSAFAPPAVTVADFSIGGGAKETTIPFRLINNHIFGAVEVNGQGPYEFLFDTGGINVVTPTLARALDLEIEGSVPEFGIGEGVIEGGFTRVAALQIGDAVVKDQVFTVLPLDRFAPIEGTAMPGLIGFEVFRRFVTRVDYERETITLLARERFDPKSAGTPVDFVFHDHIVEVSGAFEGLATKFHIDTGLRSELTLTQAFVEQHGLRAKHPRGIEAMSAWGVGGPTYAYITRAHDMTIGGIRIVDVVANLMMKDTGSLSNSVGGGLLKRFVVTFDYDRQTMYLKPRSGPVADVGTFDRAGIWFNESPQGFEIVDVIKSSPAECAGLKPGDTIVAVDGTPVSEIHLYDLREQLRCRVPGTVVLIRVKAGTSLKDVAVTLENLV